MQTLVPDWTRSDDGEKSVAAWNATFCAIELALLDWSLRADHCALADLLPPERFEVVYSSVISADEPKDAAALAKRMARLGLRQIKVKVGTPDDVARLDAVRKAVADSVPPAMQKLNLQAFDKGYELIRAAFSGRTGADRGRARALGDLLRTGMSARRAFATLP